MALAAALAAGWVAAGRGFGGLPLAASTLALILLLLPYSLFGLTNLDVQMREWLGKGPARIFALVAALLVPYVIYGIGTGTFTQRSLMKLGLFVFLPTVLLLSTDRSHPRLTWQDLLAILAIWLPFDFRWIMDIWTWPEGLGAYTINAVLAVDLAVLLFVCFRRLAGVGYRFHLRREDIRIIAVNFFSFAAVAIPLGIRTGFISFSPRRDLGFHTLGSFIGIFLLIGLPEELLFRGVIQNFLHKTLQRTWLALILTALIFGAAHLNNGPSPDWRYFLLASIAGIFYGRAYLQSGGLMAAACIHTLVDTLWRALFS